MVQGSAPCTVAFREEDELVAGPRLDLVHVFLEFFI